MPIDTGMKILLVEDAKLMLKMEKKTLNSLGFENIVEAVDGNDALSKLDKHGSFDLIISDWNMPGMSGYDLLVSVRKHEKFDSIPFLMATGRGEKKEMAKASEAGVSAFISKPFNAEELRDKIEEAVGLKQAATVEIKKERSFRISPSGKVILNMAHIQITDHLVLGVLKHLIDQGKLKPQHFELVTNCMSSWNPVANALEDGSIAGACVLAPIAMDLYSYGVPINLVLFAHKSGSIFVRNKRGGKYEEPHENFFRNKSFYIPHTMSVHNMLAHMFFTGIGLRPGVTGDANVDVSFEVVPPVKMPEFLPQNPDACGYLVAEPLGTKAIAAGNAELQFLSSELWQDHPCCVVVMQSDFIRQYSEAAFEFTDMLVKAGQFIEERVDLAAEIAVKFLDPDKSLGLKVPLLRNVLSEPQGIKTNDLYPVIGDLDRIQQYMVNKIGVGKPIDLKQFVDLRFADAACKHNRAVGASANGANRFGDARDILKRMSETDQIRVAKTNVNKEGKYLLFSLGSQKYGIDILKIKEIIAMQPIRPLPKASADVKGLINLRGQVIPIMDLRCKFEIGNAEYGERSCIIVLEILNQREIIPMGIAVDAVSEIIDISAKDVQEKPSFGVDVDIEYILAMAEVGDNVHILLDIDRVLGLQDTAEFDCD